MDIAVRTCITRQCTRVYDKQQLYQSNFVVVQQLRTQDLDNYIFKYIYTRYASVKSYYSSNFAFFLRENTRIATATEVTCLKNRRKSSNETIPCISTTQGPAVRKVEVPEHPEAKVRLPPQRVRNFRMTLQPLLRLKRATDLTVQKHHPPDTEDNICITLTTNEW